MVVYNYSYVNCKEANVLVKGLSIRQNELQTIFYVTYHIALQVDLSSPEASMINLII